MHFLLNVIGDGDRQIGDADARRGIAVQQQIVLAEAVFAGAFFAETRFRAKAGGEMSDQLRSSRACKSRKSSRAALAPS